MEAIKRAATLTDIPTREIEQRTAAAGQADLRTLSDYELWFVGGGEDTPHW
jgi:hypothetical protein